MTDFLIRTFIKNYDDVQNEKIRTSYGVLSSFVMIFCNFVLFASKLFIGFISGSYAIITDAFNNLSDTSSGIAVFLGFYYGAKPPDDEHPYGHGRLEYLSALFLSFMIIMVGFKCMATAVGKIKEPSKLTFSVPMALILILSMSVKAWMAKFQIEISEKINSQALKAGSIDSVSDILITLGVLFSYVFAPFTDFPLDAVAGFIVSLFIIFGGYNLVKDTISPLLGESADPKIKQRIVSEMLRYDDRILSVHNIQIHNYGPNRSFATMDVELPYNMTLEVAHKIINGAEKRLLSKLQIYPFIHMEPKNTEDKETKRVRGILERILEIEDTRIKLNDFQIVEDKNKQVFEFEISVPLSMNRKQVEKLILTIKSALKEKGEKDECDIHVIGADMIYRDLTE